MARGRGPAFAQAGQRRLCGVARSIPSLRRRRSRALLAVGGNRCFLVGTLPEHRRPPRPVADAALPRRRGCIFARPATPSGSGTRRPARGSDWMLTRRRDRRSPRGSAGSARACSSARRTTRARLFGVLWSLKLIRLNPAFALLARVLRNERQSLVSVTMTFIVVILFAATAALSRRTRRVSPRHSAASRRPSGGP